MIFYTLEQLENRRLRLEELIERIADGDREALGELYSLVSNDVFAYALSKTGNKADSEDIMHDTFVRIYRYAKRYVSEGKPMAWIITIAKSIIYRHNELKQRHTALNEAITDDGGTSSDIDSVIKNEYVKFLLSALNENEREIVVLHAISGLKHREIAAVLDMPLSTVLSKYNRAIKKLKEMEDTNEA